MKTSSYVLLLLVVFQVSVWADVTVVRTLQLAPQTTDGVLKARNILQVQGDKSRRQTDVFADGSLARELLWSPRTVTLISLHKGVVQRMESPEKGFQKLSLSRWRDVSQQTVPMASHYQISQSWSRVLPEQPSRTVNGLECIPFVYEWRFELYDPETLNRKHYGVRTTLWLTDITPAFQQVLLEEHAFQQAYHKKIGGAPLEDMNGLTLEYAARMTGVDKQTLYAALQQGTAHLKRIAGYPVASKTEWFSVGGKTNKPLFTINSQLELVSLQTLPETEFLPSKSKTVHREKDSYDLDATLLSQAR